MHFEKLRSAGNISPMNKLFRKIMAEVVHGMRHAMVMSRRQSYVLPPERAFPLDARNLRRDAEKVARNLNLQFRK